MLYATPKKQQRNEIFSQNISDLYRKSFLSQSMKLSSSNEDISWFKLVGIKNCFKLAKKIPSQIKVDATSRIEQ